MISHTERRTFFIKTQVLGATYEFVVTDVKSIDEAYEKLRDELKALSDELYLLY